MNLKQIIFFIALIFIGLHVKFIIDLAKIIRFTDPTSVPYIILGIVASSSILVYLYNKYVSIEN